MKLTILLSLAMDGAARNTITSRRESKNHHAVVCVLLESMKDSFTGCSFHG